MQTCGGGGILCAVALPGTFQKLRSIMQSRSRGSAGGGAVHDRDGVVKPPVVSIGAEIRELQNRYWLALR